MKKTNFLLFVFLLTMMSLVSFELSAQDHFLVEIKPLSPPTETLIKSYEGFPVIPIKANDLDGKAHDLAAKKGKNVLMYFWNLECTACLRQIDALHEIQAQYKDKLEIISFSNNGKTENNQFIANRPISFPIIPNSKMLAEGPYQSDFGYPKIFLIDEFGIIKKVLPQEILSQNIDIRNLIYESISNF